MIAAQIAAIRASAVAVVAQCDALLAALPAPAPAPPVPGASCAHPPELRLASERMGAANAWVCSGCGHEGGV